MQWTSRSAGAAALDRDAAELRGQRAGALRRAVPDPNLAPRRRRAAPTRRPERCPRPPARAPSARPVRTAARAISPGASVLSAHDPPSASKISVLAAPIARARGVGSVASASAASLCGIVTLTPRKPAAARAGTVSANRSAEPAAAGSASRRGPTTSSAAFWIAGERLWATGHPTTPRRSRSRADVHRGRLTSSARASGRPASGAPAGTWRVGLELLVARLEHARAVAAHLGHEVQEVRVSGMRGGLDRREPGVVDRRRRQALVDPRVVRRARVQLRLA